METKEVLISIEYDVSVTNADGIRCVCMRILALEEYQDLMKYLKTFPDKYYDDGGSFSCKYKDLDIMIEDDTKKINAFRTLFGESFYTSYQDIFEDLFYAKK